MNTHHIGRLAGALAGLAGALLALITAAPAALAITLVPAPSRRPPPTIRPLSEIPGWSKHPPLPGPNQVRIITEGGMPGWQITLIAVAAALLAAAVAVLLARARTARRKAITAAAATAQAENGEPAPATRA
jgi:hypothetical protein